MSFFKNGQDKASQGQKAVATKNMPSQQREKTVAGFKDQKSKK